MYNFWLTVLVASWVCYSSNVASNYYLRFSNNWVQKLMTISWAEKVVAAHFTRSLVCLSTTYFMPFQASDSFLNSGLFLIRYFQLQLETKYGLPLEVKVFILYPYLIFFEVSQSVSSLELCGSGNDLLSSNVESPLSGHLREKNCCTLWRGFCFEETWLKISKI